MYRQVLLSVCRCIQLDFWNGETSVIFLLNTVGRASLEMYRQVPLSGCCCIEWDIWNGDTSVIFFIEYCRPSQPGDVPASAAVWMPLHRVGFLERRDFSYFFIEYYRPS
jgi:hypothetical protein